MFVLSRDICFLHENIMPSDYDGKLISSFQYALRFRNEPWIETDFASMLENNFEVAFI